jgi:hypothetical protein
MNKKVTKDNQKKISLRSECEGEEKYYSVITGMKRRLNPKKSRYENEGDVEDNNEK